MKLTKANSAILATALLALLMVGCSGGDDNRVLSPDQAKEAQANNIKRIESLNIPETAKKEMESHMGGAPYSNPAVDEAKAHGVNIPPGGRTH